MGDYYDNINDVKTFDIRYCYNSLGGGLYAAILGTIKSFYSDPECTMRTDRDLFERVRYLCLADMEANSSKETIMKCSSRKIMNEIIPLIKKIILTKET